MASKTEDEPRSRRREWMRPPRELTMTAAGKFTCLLTLGVGFGAINTGNNLLFLLLGMMLSLILASGGLSEAVLRRLVAKRRLPPRLVAGTASPGEFIVDNPKGYASLSVEVADRTAVALAGPARGEVVGRPPIPLWKVWKKDSKLRPVGSAYTIRVEPRQSVALDGRWEFTTRGRYRVDEVALITRFPFGLFEKTRILQDAADVTVYPAGLDASDWMASVFSSFGEIPSNVRGHGDEFFGLREYRTGEDRRMIHWKSSARRGELVVRENEAMQQCEVEIVLCNWGATSRPAFEESVGKTVGLLGALAERGWRVGLRTAQTHLEPAGGAAHLDTLLGELAVVELGAPPPALHVEKEVARIAIGAADALGTLALPVDVRLTADGSGGARA